MNVVCKNVLVLYEWLPINVGLSCSVKPGVEAPNLLYLVSSFRSNCDLNES